MYRCCIYGLVAAALTFGGCKATYYQSAKVQYSHIEANAQQLGSDSLMQQLLIPYSKKINETMNEPLASLGVQLVKRSPENTLGYFMTDAYLTMAQKKFERKVDVAFMNPGGIRLNSIEPGVITLGKIYELMPFDNLMVLIELKGAELKQFLNQTASRGAWPVSGLSYTINQAKQATAIMVNNQPLEENTLYTVAVSDYVANGGDQNSIFKGKPQVSKGYLQRDALIDYVKSWAEQKQTIGLPIGKRITVLE
jgi:2',3'-cyclic-nucleotide 2'-phosphodiesterase (5'-nucleotidase family)